MSKPKTLTIKTTPAQKARLDALASRLNVTPADIVRAGINFALNTIGHDINGNETDDPQWSSEIIRNVRESLLLEQAQYEIGQGYGKKI